MTLLVPTQPTPNQTLQAQLAGQAVSINLYQLAYGLFMDVFSGTQLVVAGVICENRNKIVRNSFNAISSPGFVGDFAFVDTQGSDDPVYTGLGSRFLLVYLEASDL